MGQDAFYQPEALNSGIGSFVYHIVPASFPGAQPIPTGWRRNNTTHPSLLPKLKVRSGNMHNPCVVTVFFQHAFTKGEKNFSRQAVISRIMLHPPVQRTN